MDVLTDYGGGVVFEWVLPRHSLPSRSLCSIVQQDYLGLGGVFYWLLGMFSLWLSRDSHMTNDHLNLTSAGQPRKQIRPPDLSAKPTL